MSGEAAPGEDLVSIEDAFAAVADTMEALSRADRSLKDLIDEMAGDDRIRRIVRAEMDQPHGCICPVGAEATCKGLACPRRAWGAA